MNTFRVYGLVNEHFSPYKVHMWTTYRSQVLYLDPDWKFWVVKLLLLPLLLFFPFFFFFYLFFPFLLFLLLPLLYFFLFFIYLFFFFFFYFFCAKNIAVGVKFSWSFSCSPAVLLEESRIHSLWWYFWAWCGQAESIAAAHVKAALGGRVNEQQSASHQS